MSLANKLYKIGQQVSKDDIKEIIEVREFKDIGSYTTLQIDFKKDKVTLNKKAINDFSRTMFTKKIGGSGDGIFYLYPNFEYQITEKNIKEGKNLYKKFITQVFKTFENSVMVYANDENQKLAQPIWDYIREYKEDSLGLKEFESGNYF